MMLNDKNMDDLNLK
uniref:Uncharacterized protein n=1 Tax=Lepeophtheirus salmonis TaxID=72036 RepID=A0A0K2TWR2_LEPSM